MILKYRRAAVEDTLKLLELSWQAYAPIRELNLPFPAAKATKELVEANIKENIVILAEKGHELVATVSLQFPWIHGYLPYHYPYFWWLAVHPNYKRQGIASQLLNYLEEDIVKDKLKSPALLMSTSPDHPWLSDLYKKRGYENIGALRYGKNGYGIFMRKILIPELVREDPRDYGFEIDLRTEKQKERSKPIK